MRVRELLSRLLPAFFACWRQHDSLLAAARSVRTAASGCFAGAAIYAGFILFCGYRLCKGISKKPDRDALLDRFE